MGQSGAVLFEEPAWEVAAEARDFGETLVQPHCRQEKGEEEKEGREGGERIRGGGGRKRGSLLRDIAPSSAALS